VAAEIFAAAIRAGNCSRIAAHTDSRPQPAGDRRECAEQRYVGNRPPTSLQRDVGRRHVQTARVELSATNSPMPSSSNVRVELIRT
jgi:hypothetical protein